MGQRHQIYLIARIRSSSSSNTKQRKYIGAFHHKWFGGSFPLAACSRFLDLLSNPLHTRAVRAEIDMVRWDEQPGVDLGRGRDIFLPCPFTSYLFFTALGTDERRRASGSWPCNGCSEG
jgi:hypothetical protein